MTFVLILRIIKKQEAYLPSLGLDSTSQLTQNKHVMSQNRKPLSLLKHQIDLNRKYKRWGLLQALSPLIPKSEYFDTNVFYCNLLMVLAQLYWALFDKSNI